MSILDKAHILSVKKQMCPLCNCEHDLMLLQYLTTLKFCDTDIEYMEEGYYCKNVEDTIYMPSDMLDKNMLRMKDIYRIRNDLLTSYEIQELINKYTEDYLKNELNIPQNQNLLYYILSSEQNAKLKEIGKELLTNFDIIKTVATLPPTQILWDFIITILYIVEYNDSIYLIYVIGDEAKVITPVTKSQLLKLLNNDISIQEIVKNGYIYNKYRIQSEIKELSQYECDMQKQIGDKVTVITEEDIIKYVPSNEFTFDEDTLNTVDINEIKTGLAN